MLFLSVSVWRVYFQLLLMLLYFILSLFPVSSSCDKFLHVSVLVLSCTYGSPFQFYFFVIVLNHMTETSDGQIKLYEVLKLVFKKGFVTQSFLTQSSFVASSGQNARSSLNLQIKMSCFIMIVYSAELSWQLLFNIMLQL